MCATVSKERHHPTILFAIEGGVYLKTDGFESLWGSILDKGCHVSRMAGNTWKYKSAYRPTIKF